MLKTHADIIDDWTDKTAERLGEIASRHRFLVFEDRKFGDIGNTVKMQYGRGVHRIGSWAHIVNAHIFPGPEAIINSLREASEESLRVLCQSVSTEITVGTPSHSVAGSDGDDDDDDDDEEAIDDETIAKDDTASGTLSPPPTHVQRGPSSSSYFSSSSSTTLPVRKPSIVTATTTISQTTEPAPPNPASLSRSLSAGETDPQDRQAALRELGPPPHSRGLLLLAEMSSEGNLMTKEYTRACVDTARKHSDFVLGFISQRNLNNLDGSEDYKDEFISMTPGVSLPPATSPKKFREDIDTEDDDEDELSPSSLSGHNHHPHHQKQATMLRGDGAGQQYHTPREAILNKGSDVVIVGRGILTARDPGKEAERYRKAAWEAYEERVGRT